MKKILIPILSFILFISLTDGYGQSVNVKVSKDSILLGNNVSVEYTFENIEGDYLKPEFENADICGTSYRIQSTNNNGVKTTSKTHVYTLTPRQEGKFCIPSLEVQHQDELLKTNPVCIEILPNPEGHIYQSKISREQILERFQDGGSITIKGKDADLKDPLDHKSKRKRRKI